MSSDRVRQIVADLMSESWFTTQQSPEGLEVLTKFAEPPRLGSSVDAYVAELEGRLHSAAESVAMLLDELEDGQTVSVEHGLSSLQRSLVEGLPHGPWPMERPRRSGGCRVTARRAEMSSDRTPVTETTNLRIGEVVECLNAYDEMIQLVAVKGPPQWGRDMLVVWVATPGDFEHYGADATAIPWPAQHVYRIEGV